MYIADTSNHRVRKVTISTGIIVTIAGTGFTSFSGDNGDATSAALYYPMGVVLDTSGTTYINAFISFQRLTLCLSLDNLFIADSSNNRIRKVSLASGTISSIAGTGSAGFSGDNGPATSATLSNPWRVAVDTSGNSFATITYPGL